MRLRTIVLGIVVVAGSFAGALVAMNLIWPSSIQPAQPPLAAMPPLPPLSGTSTVLAPAAIALTAIRDALEIQAPKTLAGKRQYPSSQLLQNANVNWTVARGPLDVSGQADTLIVSTPLSGSLQASGQVPGGANSLTGTIGKLLGGNIGQQVQNLAGKTFDQHAEIQGTVTAIARPGIAPNWRLEPNLAAQINIADVALPFAGGKVSVNKEVAPFLDNAVRERTTALEARLRDDPFIENAARAEWTRLCRAVPLGAAAQGAPKLWLEIRPTRAIAAQPQIDAKALTLFVGLQAETRVVPNETKPDCPFPQQLDIVPATSNGSISIAVPIDIPLADVSRLVEAQLAGRTYPQDDSGMAAVTVKHAALAASGDRLLISLLVHVKPHRLFSLGSDATVHVWGRPVLDAERQTLRFADVALDVQSEAAFGVLGAAAQAIAPLLQQTLAAEVIDLKPFAEDAKKRLAAAIGGYTKHVSGVSANVTVDDVRLSGIAYDEKTLRLIANATGAVNVAITSLAALQ